MSNEGHRGVQPPLGLPPPVRGEVTSAGEAPRVLAFPAPEPPGHDAFSFRISSGGILIDGKAQPELIEAVAYASLLAETSGDLMGVDGGFTSIEIELSTGVCVIGREPSGDLIVMTGPRSTNATALRRMMGLDR